MFETSIKLCAVKNGSETWCFDVREKSTLRLLQSVMKRIQYVVTR